MTNKDLSHLIVVQDRSGSMGHIKSDAEGGLNALIEEHKKADGTCLMTMVNFDDRYEVVFQDKPIAEVGHQYIYPRGMTALLDAIGKTITTVGERLAALPEDERPGAVIFVINTDGLENSSHEYNLDQIKQMITHQQDDYQWFFVFLGANQDAIQTGASMGIVGTHSMTFDPQNVMQSYIGATASTVGMRTNTAAGKSYAQTLSETAFTEEQRKAAKKEQ